MDKSLSLPLHIRQILQDKATEKKCSGEYNDFDEKGTYLCRQCGIALFRSNNKFHSGCGWPSFDNEVSNHIMQALDVDGIRTEILCRRCHGHLGHVFHNEGFTTKNVRCCVNSLSLDFVADLNILDTEEAILAGGCFWGIEYFIKELKGVLKTEVGYCGGITPYPTYEKVCAEQTGHKEAIRIIFDPVVINYEVLLKYFFQIHDPTQKNGQGPDRGPQYESVIFYFNDKQLQIAKNLIIELEHNGYKIATQLKPISIFWPAEAYHQNYYEKNQKELYCHYFSKRFK